MLMVYFIVVFRSLAVSVPSSSGISRGLIMLLNYVICSRIHIFVCLCSHYQNSEAVLKRIARNESLAHKIVNKYIPSSCVSLLTYGPWWCWVVPELYLQVQSFELCRILLGYFSEDMYLCVLQVIWWSFYSLSQLMLNLLVNIFPELGSQNQGIAFYLWSSESHLPQPAGSAALTTAQGADDLCCIQLPGC